MYGDWLSLCKFCGGKCLEGTVLLPWTSSFLYCYKPSEIHQSPGFYQFTARGRDCRLVKSLASSDKKWKTEFFFVSSFWAGNPMDVGQNTFGRYAGDLGNLRPEGKSLSFPPLPFYLLSLFSNLHLFSYSCWTTFLEQVASWLCPQGSSTHK